MLNQNAVVVPVVAALSPNSFPGSLKESGRAKVLMAVYRCSICLEFVGVSLQVLVRHIGRCHRNDANFHVICGIDGCARTYKNFLSFRNHLIRKHNLFREQAGLHDQPAIEPDPAANIPDDDECMDGHANGLLEHNLEREIDKVRRTSALCLLKFKEEGRVPQTVVDSFVQNTTHLVQNSIGLLKSGVMNELQTAGIDLDALPGLNDLFEDTNVIANPFSGIGSERLQYIYYKDNFNLVEPRKIELGRYHVKVRRGNKLREIEKSDNAYYIPILESLQQLLHDDSILEEVQIPHSRNDDLMSDFCDGDTYKAHPLFGRDPQALQLLLYFDEVEVCNPLGSRANKHKLAAFYYTLGNIRPENRSHMNAIQLLGLVTSKHLKTYGVDPILQAFMIDLEQLEQDAGYQFIIGGQPRAFRGTVAYFSGDNLGSQFIGGFKQGSQAHRRCRVCMGNATEIKTNFHEDDFVLRSRASYNAQCQRLDQGEHYKKTYGLNKYSLLNTSRYYHVIGGLPSDAMHDILEGVLQYCVKEVLKVLINEEKYLTLEELNRRTKIFDFGYHNDSNRPAPIQAQRLASQDNSLKQHANQMWCLGLYLPLLIGDLVPEHDEHWEFLCDLVHIVRIIFTPIVNRDQIPYLQVLIQSHLLKFKELFPNCSIIPKMHYMVHMPRTILELGPLIRSWCMRYEAKHHYFKRLAVLLGNFVNLPFSLAKRHQEGLCYRLQSSEGSSTSFVEKGIEVGPGNTSYTGDVNYQDLIEAEIPGINRQMPLYEAKWISILGTKYKVGATLHIGYDANEFPHFWEIKNICIVNRNFTKVMFIVSEVETITFSEHFQSYEVAAPLRRNVRVAYSSDFTCYLPLNQAKLFGNRGRAKYVCMRHEMDTNV